MKLTSRRAFTLIELLTVIAIIGVLSAILTVAVGRARSAAQLAACSGNFRQVGIAILSYVSDHQGMLPGPLYVGQSSDYSGNPNDGRIGTFLAPYLGLPPATSKAAVRADVLTCPAWYAKMGKKGNVCYSLPGDVLLTSGAHSTPFGQAGTSKAPRKLTVIANPSTAIALQELDQLSGGTTWASDPTVAPAPVHGDVRNCVYFDGHTAPLPVTP